MTNMTNTTETIDATIKLALELGVANRQEGGKGGQKMWDKFIEEHHLTDEIIGMWIGVSIHQEWLVAQADSLPEDDPDWLQEHFKSQPHRIRLKKPASLRRIAQIAFNWTSAGNPAEKFDMAHYIHIVKESAN